MSVDTSENSLGYALLVALQTAGFPLYITIGTVPNQVSYSQMKAIRRHWNH
jgi:hypothetical protein